MKKILLLLTLSVFVLSSFCQKNKETHSLEKVLLNKDVQDTNTINQYINFGKSHVWNQPDSAIYWLNKALLLSRQLHYAKGEFDALALKAFPLAIVRADSAAVSSAYGAIKIAEDEKNKEYLPGAYLTLGSVYIYIKDYDKGILYHRNALHYSSPNTLFNGGPILYAINQHLAQCYLGVKKLDSAFVYINKVLEYNRQQNEADGFNAYLLGNIYFEKGDYDTALKHYKEALAIVNKDNIKKDIANCNIGIAAVFQRKNLPDSAIQYAKKAFAIARRAGLSNEKLEALNLLITLFDSQSKTDSAYAYQKHALALRDSVYNADKVRQVQLLAFNEEMKKQQEAEQQRKRSNAIIISLLIAALLFSLVIAGIVYKHNKQRQKAYALLQKQKAKTEQALEELKATQTQLIQREKMASLGELTSGIGHEIQNPLNFVNNFSEVNTELVEELKKEAISGNTEAVLQLANDLEENSVKINHHGKRADAIVKGMLEHSRTSKGEKQPTDINALADEYLRLSYHGLRAKDKSFNATIETRFDESIGKIDIIAQVIGRVLLYLCNNAFYAVTEKKKAPALKGENYEPTVSVITKKENDKVIIVVRDNGPGIPQKVVDKIFQPFFTTKPTGQGTGLGLSLSYDIIKSHGAELKVETKEGEGAEFIIQL